MSDTRARAVLAGVIAMILLMVQSRGSAVAGAQPGYVYALDQVSGGPNQIYGFGLDPVTGVLTPLAGFPVASGGTGAASTVSEQMVYASGRLYVVNGGNNTLSAFTVNFATGGLAAMPFSPLALGAGEWNCVTVHPTGSPVVVGNGDASPTVASFVVTGTTATPALGSPYSTGTASPFSCAFSADGNDVYTGGNVGAVFAGFNVAPSTGILAMVTGSPFNSGTNFPMAYATDGAGRLFSSNLAAGQVRAFTTASGVATAVTGNPFPSGLTFGVQGVVHPSGFYLVADRGGNQVGAYRIAGSGAGTTLTAVSGSPFASGGAFTDALAITPDGGLLVAVNGNSRNLTVFRVNGTTGSLASLGVQPANTLGAAGLISGVAFAAAEAPPAATLVSPGGGGTPTVPTFTWGAVSDAASYYLWVNNSSGTPVIQASYGASVCGPTTCAVTPSVPLASDTYTWWIQTSNVAGNGPWSTPLTFVTPPVLLPVRNVAGDFDGDRRADLTVYRPSTGGWYDLLSSTGYKNYGSHAWGVASDTPIRGDFDGDGRADIVVYRPSTGGWYMLLSSTGYTASVSYAWGVAGDIPVPGDYDGDGRTDVAVYRPSTGSWYILLSSTNYSTYRAYPWGGVAGDIPVPGDYDGDGKTDVAVYRPSNGTWYILQSSTGDRTSSSYQWGLGGDVPVPADYDGDRKTDMAVYRPSTGGWYILQSSTNDTAFGAYLWGLAGDLPVPADFDGDGKADVAVYRPSNAGWYILQSSTNYTQYVSLFWGLAGDIPLLERP